jgi:hypothetical protein
MSEYGDFIACTAVECFRILLSSLVLFWLINKYIFYLDMGHLIERMCFVWKEVCM